MQEEIRLVKLLSSVGIASRRNAGELIKSGRIKVNGKIVCEAGEKIILGKDEILFDDKIVEQKSEKVYIVLNKPRGYVCTHSDIHAEKKAIDLINIADVKLFSAGRLDKDSEGMIIFSNDGDYINKLSHPSNNILKQYEVSLSKILSNDDIEKINKGIIDEGETLKVVSVNQIKDNIYLFVLNEGKKREIRRITKAIGAPTKKLKRVKIGELNLDALPTGKWKKLSPKEVSLSLSNKK